MKNDNRQVRMDEVKGGDIVKHGADDFQAYQVLVAEDKRHWPDVSLYVVPAGESADLAKAETWRQPYYFTVTLVYRPEEK